jgi:hypothetical protein
VRARQTIPPDLLLAPDGRLFAAYRMLRPNVRAGRRVLRVVALTAREAEVVRTRLADTAGSFLAGLSSLDQPDER